MAGKFLIIDDSALMRRVISDIIKQNSEYELIDLACNGLEGFDKLVARPSYYDLVILDINMPKMNGLELLETLKKNHMRETVVVVSTVAKEGAKETIRALELGAIDFVTKPENFYEVKGEGFKSYLLAIINEIALGNVNTAATFADTTAPKPATQRVSTETVKKPLGTPVKDSGGISASASLSKVMDLEKTITKERAEVIPDGKWNMEETAEQCKGVKRGLKKLIAIASSTGGPKSLQDVIPYIPKNIDAPIVMVQHMPKGFTASLAQRLEAMGQIKVKEAQDGDILQKGCAYIAPGGSHLKVVKAASGYKIRITDDPPVEGLRPCANIMYNSLIESDFDEITCVVLTGMGADGTLGIGNLKKSGKKLHVISQNAETCVVYGMPKMVAEAGLSNVVAPLNRVAERIIRNVGVS